MKKKLFVKFKEHNDWEGETWFFYIRKCGNEKAIEYIKKIIHDAKIEHDFFIDPVELDEETVDLLVSHSGSGYMKKHQKLDGHLAIKKLKAIEDIASNFYKGGIRNFVDKIKVKV